MRRGASFFRALAALGFVGVLLDSLSDHQADAFVVNPFPSSVWSRQQQERDAPSSISSLVVTKVKQQPEDGIDSKSASNFGNNVNGFAGGMIWQGGADAKSQLFQSFAALNLGDQYDAVLTGLCAKIVDTDLGQSSNRPEGAASLEEAVIALLDDPLKLVEEMNSKRITASPRSTMALVDATARAQDAATMTRSIELCIKNGSVLRYGSQQNEIEPLPNSPTARVRKVDDSGWTTRQERLESAQSIPRDDRAGEITSAMATVAVAGSCEVTDLLNVPVVEPVAQIVLATIFTVGVLDNFYDIIRTASNFFVQQVNDNAEKNSETSTIQKKPVQVPKLPEKDALPMGLGSGQVTGQVVRGLTRLFTVDPTREARSEAAALFTAYTLALPCFAFRSNALEAAVLAVESVNGPNKKTNSLLNDRGLLRLLVWLLAPVAAENQKYPVCIISDYREADSFLERLESLAQNSPDVANALWWRSIDDNDGGVGVLDTREREDLLQWAFAEADVLLRRNQAVVDQLADRLEGGAATIGDCLAVLEGW